MRRYIALTTFGFYKGGILNVKLINFKANPMDENAIVRIFRKKTLTNYYYFFFPQV